jgi:MFS family permease
VYSVSITSFVSNSVLGLFVSPIIGWLSDIHGRKPFFLAGAFVLAGMSMVRGAWCYKMPGDLPRFIRTRAPRLQLYC